MVVLCSTAAQIGRQLAYIGDSINERHSAQFSQMIRLLNLTPETAYEAFAGIARKYAAVSFSLSVKYWRKVKDELPVDSGVGV